MCNVLGFRQNAVYLGTERSWLLQNGALQVGEWKEAIHPEGRKEDPSRTGPLKIGVESNEQYQEMPIPKVKDGITVLKINSQKSEWVTPRCEQKACAISGSAPLSQVDKQFWSHLIALWISSPRPSATILSSVDGTQVSVTLHSSFGHHNGLLSGISIFHQPYLLFPDLGVFAILYLAPCSGPVCSGIDCWMTCYSPVVAFWASLPLTLSATDKFSSHLDIIIVMINNNNRHIHCFSFFKPFQINFL